MAIRSRSVGTGLGLKPIGLGPEPYEADSDFDSTVRIPIRASRTAIAPSIAAAPPPPPPGTPSLQPPPPPVVGQPPPAGIGPSQPTSYDPQQLNFEGSTYTGPSAYQDVPDPAAWDRVSGLVERLSDAGINLSGDWREKLRFDRPGLMAEIDGYIKRYVEVGGPRGPLDTKARQRLLDLQAALKQELGKTVSQVNPQTAPLFLGQELYNRSLERLKMVGASGAREEEEELMALLSSRGLLNSGIASRELARLRQTRQQNLFDAASRLNELLLSGEISRLSARDMATLEAELQRRNQEALLRLKASLDKDAQPSPWAQIAGTAIGTALPFLLSPKGPSPGAGTPSGERLYGGETSIATRGNTYRRPPFEY